MLINRISNFLNQYHDALRPIKGNDNSIESIFLLNDFKLYPTKRKTIVFCDEKTNTFVKILYPLKFKERLKARFNYPSKRIYLLSKTLRKADIKVPTVLAYGKVKKGNLPFFIMEKVAGTQLKMILIRQKKLLPMDVYFDVIKNIADLHRAGYWFRDLHLAHIYIEDLRVSGFIDIENIRKNIFLKIKKQAKDLSGLNHPALPLSEKEKRMLFEYYMENININCKDKFISYINYYSDVRWKRISK
jgi:tRNA A-37 threonylcarbamoyl transferase component Bud32